jgi:hypothetical protein
VRLPTFRTTDPDMYITHSDTKFKHVVVKLPEVQCCGTGTGTVGTGTFLLVEPESEL